MIPFLFGSDRSLRSQDVVCPCVRPSGTLFRQAGKQASKQASRRASKQARKQACTQAGKQGSRKASTIFKEVGAMPFRGLLFTKQVLIVVIRFIEKEKHDYTYVCRH